MRKIHPALLLVLTWAFVGAGRGAEGDARAVLEQAIKAHGGDRLARAQVREVKGTLAAGTADLPFTGELALHPPDRMRVKFELGAGDLKQTVVLVLNGNRGWRSATGMVNDLGPSELEDVRDDAYAFWLQGLVPLRDKEFQLSTIPEIKVDGKPAAGVKVARQGRVDVELYFDKESHLLVKMARKTKEAGVPMLKESVFSAHKAFGGLMLPTRVLELSNGKKTTEQAITGYKFPDKLDDSQFARP